MMLIWSLIGLAFLVALIALVLYVVRRSPQGGLRAPGPSAALAVLEERYARGEIGREEFLERRSVLTAHGRGSGP